jgi:hypothetical protein
MRRLAPCLRHSKAVQNRARPPSTTTHHPLLRHTAPIRPPRVMALQQPMGARPASRGALRPGAGAARRGAAPQRARPPLAAPPLWCAPHLAPSPPVARPAHAHWPRRSRAPAAAGLRALLAAPLARRAPCAGAAHAPAAAPAGAQPHMPRRAPVARATAQEEQAAPAGGVGAVAPALVGEDAAAFDWGQQSLKSWAIFGVLLTGVLGALYAVRREGGCVGEGRWGDCAMGMGTARSGPRGRGRRRNEAAAAAGATRPWAGRPAHQAATPPPPPPLRPRPRRPPGVDQPQQRCGRALPGGRRGPHRRQPRAHGYCAAGDLRGRPQRPRGAAPHRCARAALGEEARRAGC